jgi:FxLD family lantipeptide
MATQMTARPAPDQGADFNLDVSIVEAGDAVNALLCSTDNGCDTVGGSDC